MSAQVSRWLNFEPFIGLLIILMMLGWSILAFTHSRGDGKAVWGWLRRIIEVVAGMFCLVGLLVAFRVLLDSSLEVYRSAHGSFTQANSVSAIGWNRARAVWGGPVAQDDLIVQHFVEQDVQEELPRTDALAAPHYRTVKQRVLVPQNSVVGFDGDVNIELSDPEKRARGEPLFNTFTVDARYEYQVANLFNLETEAEFTFSLWPDSHLIDDFHVLVDGEDYSNRLHFSSGIVTWKKMMAPNQRCHVSIAYKSPGMERFYYQVKESREVIDFSLNISVNVPQFEVITEPGADAIHYESQPQTEGGIVMTWKIDRALMAPKMGISMTQPPVPYGPYDIVIRVLEYSPNGLLLLATILPLTLLLYRVPMRFSSQALLCGIYSLQFIALAGTSDYFGFEGAMILWGLVNGVLAVLLIQRFPGRFLRILAFVLMALFMIAYPLIGLLPDLIQRDQVENGVRVAIIIYLFGFTLYTQIRSRTKQPSVSL